MNSTQQTQPSTPPKDSTHVEITDMISLTNTDTDVEACCQKQESTGKSDHAETNSPKANGIQTSLKEESSVKQDYEITHETSMRRQISLAFTALKNNKQVTFSAFGESEVCRLVQMVEIIKTRLGMLHQLNKIVVKQTRKQGQDTDRFITGCKVILSRTQLDDKDPGYQKPKPSEPRFNCKFAIN